jgi:RsiW-degrading membrane proteinase PrsW (M82 family)
LWRCFVLPDKEAEIDEAVLIISLLSTGLLLLAGLQLLAMMVLEKKVINFKEYDEFPQKLTPF